MNSFLKCQNKISKFLNSTSLEKLVRISECWLKSIETSWRLQVITKSNYTEEYGLTLKAKNQVTRHPILWIIGNYLLFLLKVCIFFSFASNSYTLGVNKRSSRSVCKKRRKYTTYFLIQQLPTLCVFCTFCFVENAVLSWTEQPDQSLRGYTLTSSAL